MMNRIRRLFAVASAVLLLPAWAGAQQSATIVGRVTAEGGAPLAAATVMIQALNLGTTTNAEGRYTLTVPAARVDGQQVTLSVSLIGYRSASVQFALSPGSITHDFSLATDALRLSEIVVTGAGLVTTREKLGNTINSVRSDAIMRSNEPNVVSAIAGKAPNVEVSSQSGEPGASSYIRIRGVKTIQGSGQPLFVVDGVPIDNSTHSTGGGSDLVGNFTASTVATNRASDINPADIESMEILKGAAAAAIYGSRAAQGVVLITTKKGQPGQTRFSLRSSYTMDEVNKAVPLQRKFGQGTGGKAAVCGGPDCFLTGASWGAPLPAGTPTYDNFGALFRTGHMFDNTLTMSGGSERTTFYLSLGRLNHEGTIVGPNNWYDRTTARINASHRLADNLSVGGNVAYVETQGSFIQKGSNTSGLMLGGLRSPPEFDNRNYKDANGLHRSYRYPQPTLLGATRGYDNPFFVINEGINTGNTGRVFGNVSLDYTPLAWLSLKYTLGTDYYADERRSALPPSSSSYAGGQVIREDFINQQIDHNLLATATRTFNENVSGTLTLGHNLSSRKFRRIETDGLDYIAPTVHHVDNTITKLSYEYVSLVHDESVFGQGTLDLYDQLYLTTSLRYDGSSTFAQSQRRYWYPKVSGAWTFTKLVSDGSGFFNLGKVRAAWGQTGRQPDVYSMLTAFSAGDMRESWNPFLTMAQNGMGGLRPSSLKGQEKIKPERTRETEVGLDLGLFEQRAAFGVTYYDARSTDVIFALPVPPSTGYFQQVQNGATINNKGWELTLDLRPLTKPKVAWEVGFQWAKNDNRVQDLIGAQFVDMDGAFSDAPPAAVKGSRVGVLRGFDFARCGRGLKFDGVDIDAACGNAPKDALYIGADGFPILDETSRVIMDPHPDWTASIRTGLVLFNRLEVAGLLDFKHGGQVWNGTKGALYNFGTHKDTEMRGENRTFGQNGFHEGPVGGPGAGKSVVIDEDWFTDLGSGFGPVAAQFIEDGGFVKLREISLGYTLDTPFLRSLGLRTADLRIAGRNLVTWTKYTGIDPETNLAGAEVSLRGIDYFNNPQTRSFVFTVGLNR